MGVISHLTACVVKLFSNIKGCKKGGIEVDAKVVGSDEKSQSSYWFKSSRVIGIIDFNGAEHSEKCNQSVPDCFQLVEDPEMLSKGYMYFVPFL